MPSSSSLRSSSPTLGKTRDFPLRAFFGHHKCATGFIDGILREVCYHMGLRFRIAHGEFNFAEDGSLPAFVEHKNVDLLAYTNADLQHAAGLPLYRGFHVVRDPRDVLVSAYFSHRNSHGTRNWTELVAHREALQTCSKEEGLFLEMEFSRPFFEDMARWDYQQSAVLELHMEELTADPVSHFIRIFDHLDMLQPEEPTGVDQWLQSATMTMNRLNQKGRRFMPGSLPLFPVPRRRLARIPASGVASLVERRNFKKLSGGRKKGQENVHSHYRKGTPGDWINHLTPAHIDHFKAEYNDLLVLLGYEEDASW